MAKRCVQHHFVVINVLCPDSHVGLQVMGKTLAVAGLGNIGAKVAKAGLDLGMKVCSRTCCRAPMNR